MKRVSLLTALLVTVFASQGFAQEPTADSMLELLRSDFKTTRKALVEKVMKFSEKEANVFWPFYREYELEVSKLGDTRLAILKEYAANYEKIDDEKAESLVKQTIDLQEDRTELMGKYYKKGSKLLGKKRAAQWIQVENQINALVDAQMVDATPLIK